MSEWMPRVSDVLSTPALRCGGALALALECLGVGGRPRLSTRRSTVFMAHS